MTIRTRFAPSPTGYFHVGGAWMTFFNWLFARSRGGTFVLRVEDTDPSRSAPEFEAAIYEDIRWLGLDWDEGPDVGGPYGPYRQSARGEIYAQHAQDLIASGDAYYCWCTPDELEAEKRQAEAERRPHRYSRRCLRASDAERARFAVEGRRPVVRFHVRGAEPIVVDDMILGPVTFDSVDIDDFIIMRSDGSPLYNFANVVDDHGMAVTHILRGREHLSNTPRQWLTYRAFGWPMPRAGHLPTLLGADRKKLSKRHGDTALRDYRDNLYLPEAMVNFFALMGWYPEDGREIFSLPELLARFDLAQVGKSNAIFDLQKLTWMNGVYMREVLHRDLDRAVGLFADFLVRRHVIEAGQVTDGFRDYLRGVVTILGDRLKAGEDLLEYGLHFFVDSEHVSIPRDLGQRLLDAPGARGGLADLRERLARVDDFHAAEIERVVREVAAGHGVEAKAIIHPVRLALSGQTIGPGLFETMEVLGKTRVLERLDKAIRLIGRDSSSVRLG